MKVYLIEYSFGDNTQNYQEYYDMRGQAEFRYCNLMNRYKKEPKFIITMYRITKQYVRG